MTSYSYVYHHALAPLSNVFKHRYRFPTPFILVKVRPGNLKLFSSLASHSGSSASERLLSFSNTMSFSNSDSCGSIVIMLTRWSHALQSSVRNAGVNEVMLSWCTHTMELTD